MIETYTTIIMNIIYIELTYKRNIMQYMQIVIMNIF